MNPIAGFRAVFALLLFQRLAMAQIPADADKQAIAPVVRGNNAFASALYSKLPADDKSNLFFSPASIHTALGMTYAGAAGDTARQMAATLSFSLPPGQLAPAFRQLLTRINTPRNVPIYSVASTQPAQSPAYQLSVANALWAQGGWEFKPEFIESLTKDYSAKFTELDFAKPEPAREVINDWVAAQTGEKIKDLIPRGGLSAASRLVLTNAVYFKSAWDLPFNKGSTRDEPFKLAAAAVSVPMMHMMGQLALLENDDFQMLELPYTLRELSMLIILPKKTDGLAEVSKKLDAARIDDSTKSLKPTRVEVALPRFTFSSQFALANVLRVMGMTDAFDPDKADFSGMSSKGTLYISDVIHKAFVAVDEEGTEAAAATAVIMKAGAMRPSGPPVVFTADHPFLFLVRHNPTGEILFMGRVSDPRS